MTQLISSKQAAFTEARPAVCSLDQLSCKNNRGSKMYNYQFLRMSSTIPGMPSHLSWAISLTGFIHKLKTFSHGSFIYLFIYLSIRVFRFLAYYSLSHVKWWVMKNTLCLQITVHQQVFQRNSGLPRTTSDTERDAEPRETQTLGTMLRCPGMHLPFSLSWRNNKDLGESLLDQLRLKPDP